MLSELDKGRQPAFNEGWVSTSTALLWRIQLWGSLIKSQVKAVLAKYFSFPWFRVWLSLFIAESSYFFSMTLFISS